MGLIAARIASIPWSLTAHRWDIAENNLLGVKAGSASFVRAINCTGASEMRKAVEYEEFDPIVIHMGVPISAQADLNVQRAHPFRGLMAANLIEVKGHVYLLDAMANLAEHGVDVHLDIAGSGPLRAELERSAADRALSDRVRFLGQLSHPDLLDRMRSSEWDFVVLPSIVTATGEHEGTPVILMEAMSCGIPVIATSTGGIPELLEGGAGVLVPEKNSAALATAIRQLEEDRDFGVLLGKAGRLRVEEAYSIEAVVDELERQIAASCDQAKSRYLSD